MHTSNGHARKLSWWLCKKKLAEHLGSVFGNGVMLEAVQSVLCYPSWDSS